ncbi:TAXI family TRAP transporter solute-binding subunit [Salipiger marinus]|mgnify:CR=1 FL=1|uniref:NMT1-like family protein n=1 Tax=Salipiger marinus TaxID=555512 RepID=A0A1G8PA42_9RHOB|nr:MULTISPECIES: TAXI family TRAP transporter solute-binding subunit [Salipiger]HBM60911.1 C4-dicarboxylate ABC transporter substrate-binding protein [Citreicella sp.]MCD1618954.1 TAXI family TRAP transporter solute-binding subunit [Salipiger manganoxidans]MEB3419864.1 TAXI family TRAP transporter solute-binding subunit [Salipiger manganoxidans]SDI89369.1 NMT1-like family protein [Salipiger marinus]HBT02115.1 C4-dicarboxylate ABC transporter substrate-binding protein [Citreicella sp.]
MKTGFKLGAAAGGLMALSAFGAAAQDLPDTMVWTSYDVGSAGYAEASAIADAFGKEFGTRVRIQPSGSGIGRLQPLLQGRADYAFLATEAFFVSEGAFDFATPDWGPRALRAVAGRPAGITLIAAGDAGIDTVADARGKRIAFVAGNPSVNVKCEAILAFGGLTLDDVEVITFPTYAAAMSSMTRNESDATCTTPTTSQLYELAESPRGIHYAPLEAENAAGWEGLLKVLPIMGPSDEDVAAGLAEGEIAKMAAYRYPVITTTTEQTADEVYAFIKALDESYDLYKDGTATMSRWSLDISGRPAIDVPFHDGAIRYLKEKGIWTEEDDAWNAKRTERMDALLAAWEEFKPQNDGLSEDEFAEAWMARRAEVVAGLN